MINTPFIERINEVDSTNSELKRRVSVSDVEVCSALIAERQTAGKGRKGRTWINTDDALMMSISIPVLNIGSDKLPLINHAASLAVFNSIRQLDGFCDSDNTGIKWPNDVLLDGRKVCGILSEIVINTCEIPHAIIGIGININAESFPKEMLQPVTSVKHFIGRSTNKYDLAECVMKEVLKMVSMLECVHTNELVNDECKVLIDEYKQKCITIGNKITVYPNFSEPYGAFAEEIDKFGRLIVTKDDGVTTVLDSADVSVRWLTNK